MYIEVRTCKGDILFTAPVREGESWTDTLTRRYNAVVRDRGQHKRTIGLSEHFAGGGTWHVQMGYHVPTGGMTLDDTIVVRVAPE